MAGYSGKPLAAKLGIKPGMQVVLLGAPDALDALLAPLPEGVTIARSLADGTAVQFLHYFTTQQAQLQADFAALKAALAPAGMLWISWPKRASKVATDLDEHVIRATGLAHGLVDVKVAAVDETWSALKFVYRKADRPRSPGAGRP